MRRTNQKHLQPQISKPVQNPMPTPSKPIEEPKPEIPVLEDEKMAMDIEEKKEDINLEEVLCEKSQEENKILDLNDENGGEKGKKKPKEKKPYDIDDTVIREITLAGDIHVRLISNINGYFVDFRKYYKGFPTKKGIRMLASKFVTAAEYLKQDLSELLPKDIKK